MNMMSIHIDETLAGRDIKALKDALTALPYVCNVELSSSMPHDLMVEYEEHHNMPVMILDKLSQQGLHSGIQSC